MKAGKAIFILGATILSSIKSFAQKDSSNHQIRFAITTDVVLDMLNEKNLGLEVKISPRIAFGISYAIVKPSLQWGDHVFIASHDEFPGRIYTGSAIKLNLKYYIFPKKKLYLQSSFQYKTLHYDSADFFDGGDGQGVEFSRANDKAKLFGADILMGIEIIALRHIYFDVFTGWGYRYRSRTYTTYKNGVSQYNSNTRPPGLGDYLIHQNYIAPVLGLRMGFCYTKK